MDGIPQELRRYTPENRERCRRAIAAVIEPGVRGDKKAISVEKVLDAGAKDRNGTTTMLRLWRSGALSVAESWDDPPAPAASTASSTDGDQIEPRAQLAARIRAATTDGDRQEIVQEVAALVAAEVLDPDEAAQIKGAIAEARLSAEAKRVNEPPPEDPSKLRLASLEAMNAAAALDMFVDDARRDRVLALIAAELDADRLAHPNEDEGGA